MPSHRETEGHGFRCIWNTDLTPWSPMHRMPALSDSEPVRDRQVAARAAAFLRLGMSGPDYLRALGMPYPRRLEFATALARKRKSDLLAIGIADGDASKTAAWDVVTAIGVRRADLLYALRSATR